MLVVLIEAMTISLIGRYRSVALVALALSPSWVSAQNKPEFYQTPTFQSGPALVAADFNNDGRLDIATGNAPCRESEFRNPAGVTALQLRTVA